MVVRQDLLQVGCSVVSPALLIHAAANGKSSLRRLSFYRSQGLGTEIVKAWLMKLTMWQLIILAKLCWLTKQHENTVLLTVLYYKDMAQLFPVKFLGQ